MLVSLSVLAARVRARLHEQVGAEGGFSTSLATVAKIFLNRHKRRRWADVGRARLTASEGWLVESEVYPEKLAARGLEHVRPEPAEREEINRIIMDELVCGAFMPEAVACFQRVIGRMKEEGCDAVVLGCTEIPLILSDANSPLPTLDSTRLLAQAALRRAVQGSAAP